MQRRGSVTEDVSPEFNRSGRLQSVGLVPFPRTPVVASSEIDTRFFQAGLPPGRVHLSWTAAMRSCAVPREAVADSICFTTAAGHKRKLV